MKSRGLNIRAKLLLAFTLVVWFVGMVSYLSVDHGARQINQSFNEIVNVITPQLQALLEIKSTANELEAHTLGFELIGGEMQANNPAVAAHKNDLLAGVEKINKWIERFQRLIDRKRAQEVAFARKIGNAKEDVVRLAFELLQLKEQKISDEEQFAKKEELRRGQENLKEFIAEAIAYELNELDKQNTAATATVANTIRFNIFIVGGAVLIAFVIGIVLSNVLSSGIVKVRDAARAITEGNLNKRVFVRSRDEVGELAHAFNEMAAALQETYARLEQERDRLDAIIANLETGIIEYDHEFRILLMNQKAEEMLGVKKEQVVDTIVTSDMMVSRQDLTPFVQVLYPILAEEVKKIHIKDGTPDIIEMKLGKPLELDVQTVTIPIKDKKGVIARYLKVVRDVSREKAIAKSKSEFISVAAHQLRTPLSAIKWVFRLMLDEDAGPISQEQKDLLKKGYESNERMIELVTDMLDVARIEEGRFGFDFRYADTAALIIKSIEAFTMKAKEKSIALTFEKRGTIPSPIKMDPARIELVLQNLIDNALKYTPLGGAITVTAEAALGYIKVSVADTGIGIPKEQLPKLFSKFFRGTNAVKFQTEGSGLGLFIIKNIVERHGGAVFAETEEGKGSTFSFTIPIEEDKIPKQEEKAEEFIRGLSTEEEKPEENKAEAFEKFVEGI
ncbi:HAMP domain-containing protein [Candidatus Azambacteria bacterium]|nr:HAMP domain-containing protein [Candidatus Azambacteria bacterium]